MYNITLLNYVITYSPYDIMYKINLNHEMTDHLRLTWNRDNPIPITLSYPFWRKKKKKKIPFLYAFWFCGSLCVLLNIIACDRDSTRKFIACDLLKVWPHPSILMTFMFIILMLPSGLGSIQVFGIFKVAGDEFAFWEGSPRMQQVDRNYHVCGLRVDRSTGRNLQH
jgi:hypothetical protein